MATARLCVKKGHRVIVTGRRQELLDRLEFDNPHFIILIDQRQMTDLDKLKQVLHQKKVTLDRIFLNAGIFHASPFDVCSEELYEELLHVNLKGPFFTSQALLPFLQDHGSILFNTSVST